MANARAYTRKPNTHTQSRGIYIPADVLLTMTKQPRSTRQVANSERPVRATNPHIDGHLREVSEHHRTKIEAATICHPSPKTLTYARNVSHKLGSQGKGGSSSRFWIYGVDPELPPMPVSRPLHDGWLPASVCQLPTQSVGVLGAPSLVHTS